MSLRRRTLLTRVVAATMGGSSKGSRHRWGATLVQHAGAGRHLTAVPWERPLPRVPETITRCMRLQLVF
jgi:hypothetical protein